MERESFGEVARRLAASSRPRAGIGTLGEKLLHQVLKYYIEPESAWHEIRVGGYVADIFGRDGIVEIQTRNFSNLRKKLEALLSVHPVTVVYPAVRNKWLRWIDPETGEVTERRKSPKTGTPAAVFPELYRIRPLLFHPNFSLRVLLVDMEETRLKNGWSEDGKRGSRRCDRIPLELRDDLTIRSPSDYYRLLPEGLAGAFTAKEFGKRAALGPNAAGTAVRILTEAGVLSRTGKSGRAYLYEVSRSAGESLHD